MPASRTAFRSIVVLLSALALQSFAAEPMRVVGITDGDTATMLGAGNRQTKCRLFGIDTPESGQAHGKAAKRALSDAIYGKTVGVEVVDTDRYGRSICRISEAGQDVNLAMVEQGYAWVYRRYNRDPQYLRAEERARAAGWGLWSDPNPVPPWQWRRANK
jgi:endonuclease YncB( thermonuclease family)